MREPSEIVSTARKAFNLGKTKSYEARYRALEGLLRFIEDNETQITEILKKENGKPYFEVMSCELNPLKNEIKNTLYKLKDWMKPAKVEKPLAFIMDQPMIQYDPYGVVLVMGAWNYPFMLTLSPAIGAIAAGNCVIMKPSDVTPLCAQFLEQNLPKYLDSECFPVFDGGIAETTILLEQKFDYIFYTGGTQVGKIIYQAAAKNLTPVTLELGGKSPVYLDDSADIDVAASRIMWGKCLNAGQSCIGPDYLLCSEFVRDKFIKAAKKSIKGWYGENSKENPDYVPIVNERHFNRIKNLLEEAKIAMGGETDQSKLYIEPTIVTDVKRDDPIMREEIFGPVLPIYTVASPEEAIEYINNGEKPLAVYVFGNSKTLQEKFLKQTSSGGICFNDTLLHFACSTLPFGGVGNSGIGMYHGKFSFETFSHKKEAKIAMGGETDQSKLYIEPTIVTDVKRDDPIMREEIFGPVLPIYTVASPEEAIEYINNGEKPLAVYVFGNSKTLQEKFLKQTSSGGICFNDTLLHFACSTLPFGGVGNSGIGMYHGKFSFETFSHKKATLVKKLDKVGEMALGVRYPPYSDKKLKILTAFTRPFPPIPGSKYFCRIMFFLMMSYILYLVKFHNSC